MSLHRSSDLPVAIKTFRSATLPRLLALRWAWLMAGAGLLLCAAQMLAADDKPAAAKASANKGSVADKDDMPDEEEEEEGDATPGFRLEKVNEIVVWNEHNGKRGDNGTQTCNLSLMLDGKTVWEKKDVEIPWAKDQSEYKVVDVSPDVQADTVRVEITAWNEKGGGLAELEVLDKTGTNLGFGGKVKTSAERTPVGKLGGDALIDGVYDPRNDESGYWLLPDGQEGWAEIELVPQKVPPPPKERKAAKKGKKKISRMPLGADLMVACQDSFDLYINGEHALSGHGKRLFKRHITIANGDIVTARCESATDKGGFCIKIQFPNGHFLSTVNGWKAYTPADPVNWFVPERVKPSGDIVRGAGWAEGLMKEENSSMKVPIPQIWGTGKISYIAMQADTTVKHKKMVPTKKKR